MSTKLLPDIVFVLPIIVLLLSSLLPVMIKVFLGNTEPSPTVTAMYAFIGLAAAIGLTASLSGANTTAFNNAITIDGITIWMSYLVYFIALVSVMLAYENVMTRGKQFAEFVFLMMSSTVGMIVLLMSNDLIVTFIGIETMSLSLYILIAMSKETVLSKEASFKYFILGSFASAIFLYGVSFIYGTVGSTFLPHIAEQGPTLISTSSLFFIGVVLVVLGFAFKVSVFPMHAWTPDVYQGAPTPITAFMSTAVKAATFVAFLRFFDNESFIGSPRLQTALEWLAIFTMFAGNAAALIQNNFKRMLSYSSVAHSGYLMVGLIAAGFSSGTNFSVSGILFYLFTYSIMTLGTFAVVALYEKKASSSVSVDDLRGLASRNPVLALCLTILMLSLAGIPPTLGFFGKFYIFSAAVEQGMYWLVFWGLINSVISVYYYLRPVVLMYMSESQGEEIEASSMLTRAVVIGSAILVVVLGICSTPIWNAAKLAAKSMTTVAGN